MTNRAPYSDSLVNSVCLWSLAVILLVWGVGCRPEPEGVRSHLEGRIQVQSNIDASGDHSGFRVLVLQADSRTLDTLGQAVTDRDGRFEMTVTAPERGVYPLTIWGRQGQQKLVTRDLVVAEGDTATLKATLPLEGRRLYLRSAENAALSAYRNTLAQHQRTLIKRLRTDHSDSTAMTRSIRRTSSMLWRLQETFPGTYASHLGAAESLALLAGWSDSLVVERARAIDPSNPRYVEVARIARRAEARLHGQEAALRLLDEFETRAETTTQRAGIQSIRVRAFVDSLQAEAALSAAQTLKNEYPNTKWADWADRAMYEVNNLLPGSEAPSFEARTIAGDSLSIRDFRGQPVLLEYFRPGDDLFSRQLAMRNVLYKNTRSDSVAFVSVSVEPDTLLYRAFSDGRFFPGNKIIAQGGMDDPIAKTYNVAEVPSRVLIDANGDIVGRYPGAGFLALQEDLMQLLQPDE